MAKCLFVVGCGSIGQRHIRNLHELGCDTVVAFDRDLERAEHVSRNTAVRVVSSLEAGFAVRPDAVLVCTPPFLHVEVATQAVLNGAHVFIEKPISHVLDGVDDLLAEARRRQQVVAVGYNLRFHSGLRRLKELVDAGTIGRILGIRAEMGQYLPTWRPGADYRTGYIARPETGGGIILDASHELDYVRWLGGEVTRIFCAADHLSDLEISTEDVAAITLRLQSGAIAEIHLDCVQRGYTRTCKVIGDLGSLSWDFRGGIALTTDAGLQPLSATEEPDTNAMYVSEIRQFLLATDGTEPPRVDGATGKRVLELALAAQKSARTGQELAV